MQTLKQKGFTLIELLVVIVIIGILATISVATFSGYFAKARDSERQAAIRNAATIMKTARAVETISSFDNNTTDGIDVSTTLADEGGYAVPTVATGGNLYAYGYNSTALATPASPVGDEFFIMVCSEEDPTTYFIDGTSRAVADVATSHGTTAICSATDVDPTNATVTNYTLTAGASL